MAAVLALLGASSLSWQQWAAGAIAGGVVYLLVLTATGEISRSEIAAVTGEIAFRLRAAGARAARSLP
jgi:hypothetical protein